MSHKKVILCHLNGLYKLLIRAIARSLSGVNSSYLLIYCWGLERMRWIMVASWVDSPGSRLSARVPGMRFLETAYHPISLHKNVGSEVDWPSWPPGGLACRIAVVPRALFLHSLSEHAFSSSWAPGSVLNSRKPKTKICAPVSSI